MQGADKGQRREQAHSELTSNTRVHRPQHSNAAAAGSHWHAPGIRGQGPRERRQLFSHQGELHEGEELSPV